MLFLMALVVNPLLGLLNRDWVLTPPELAQVYVMWIVGSGVATNGLPDYLLPHITSMAYYISPENAWAEAVIPFIPELGGPLPLLPGHPRFLRRVRRRHGAVGDVAAGPADRLGADGDVSLGRHGLGRRHPAQAVDRPRAARLPDDAAADRHDPGRRRPRRAPRSGQAPVPQLDLLARLHPPLHHRPQQRSGPLLPPGPDPRDRAVLLPLPRGGPGAHGHQLHDARVRLLHPPRRDPGDLLLLLRLHGLPDHLDADGGRRRGPPDESVDALAHDLFLRGVGRLHRLGGRRPVERAEAHRGRRAPRPGPVVGGGRQRRGRDHVLPHRRPPLRRQLLIHLLLALAPRGPGLDRAPLPGAGLPPLHRDHPRRLRRGDPLVRLSHHRLRRHRRRPRDPRPGTDRGSSPSGSPMPGRRT